MGDRDALARAQRLDCFKQSGLQEPMSRSARELPRIEIRDLQRMVDVDLGALKKSAAMIIELVSPFRRSKPTPLSRLREISVLLISDRRMSQLHRQFLHQPGPTDVITFDHGEIFISVETARRNARAFGNTLRREIQLYIVHGLLHLHGFDDRTAKQARMMKRMQEKILRSLP